MVTSHIGNGYDYQVFKLLSTWYQRVIKFVALTEMRSHFVDIFEKPEVFYNSMLETIWTNIDSPCEGVHDYVIQIFCSIIKLISILCENTNVTYHKIYDYIMGMSWTLKGKTSLLAILVQNAGMNLVSRASIYYSN